MHSEDSDGAETVEEMADACRARGYTKASVTDHSHGLTIAGGMSLETMRRQHDVIDAFNARTRPFRLLKGIEANILADGALDLSFDERQGLEMIVASPHLALRKTFDQTERMVRAVSEPGVHVLGHPRGRVFNTRAGIVADWKLVFERAVETGVAIEIDGDPSRQDLDATLAREALDAGCVFALDSDAHSRDQLDFVRCAVAHARLAGIPRERVINYWSADQILEWSEKAWKR
jgi:histidinol phosphatase-like PHP family hydrolase